MPSSLMDNQMKLHLQSLENKNNLRSINIFFLFIIICTFRLNLSPKFKRVLFNETPEIPFWSLNICVDFDLRI